MARKNKRLLEAIYSEGFERGYAAAGDMDGINSNLRDAVLADFEKWEFWGDTTRNWTPESIQSFKDGFIDGVDEYVKDQDAASEDAKREMFGDDADGLDDDMGDK